MSLGSKLALLVVGLTAVVLVGVALFLSGSWSAWSRDALERELRDRAQELAEHVEQDKRGGALELEDRGKLVAKDPSRPFRITGPAGVVAAHGELPWPAPENGVHVVQDEIGRPWRVLSKAMEAGEHGHHRGPSAPIFVQVAGLDSATGALEARFRRGLAVALVVALLLGGIGAAVLAHLSLAPLRRLAAEVDAIGPTSLDRRVGMAARDPDLGRVASAFNDLLARLEDAMRQQRSFVSRASHSLRTPTATILARAEVALRRERSGEAYREALAEIATAARESSSLVNDLLALARLDERRAPRLEAVALHALAAEIGQLLRARAEQSGLALEVDVPVGMTVTFDRNALREMLDALLDNAVRYTPHGGRVGLRALDAGDGGVITVWNSGPGIPSEERAHVFEPFRRGSAADATGAPGSGLGLAIVKAIAEAHGATVVLEERKGGGVEAVVTLRAARVVSTRGSVSQRQ